MSATLSRAIAGFSALSYCRAAAAHASALQVLCWAAAGLGTGPDRLLQLVEIEQRLGGPV